MNTQTLHKVKASMMNAIHDLPLLVARDEGFFADEGLDVEIVTTPGTGQHASDHQALRHNVFSRTMEATFEQGGCDQFWLQCHQPSIGAPSPMQANHPW